MTTPVKATLISLALIIVLVIAAIIVTILNRPATPAPDGVAGAVPVTRANSHVVDNVGEDAPPLVEVLDFECEACGALYPAVEQIRADYEGEINYVIRYFPLPGHFNSMNAAIAAEAAAQQDEFEGMYHRLFETQTQWGEQQVSQADLFRTFAEELGLDMDAYDAAVADPATKARVEEDFNDGQNLGVSGTPSFFLDGQKLELTQLSDLTDALDEATGR